MQFSLFKFFPFKLVKREPTKKTKPVTRKAVVEQPKPENVVPAKPEPKVQVEVEVSCMSTAI